MRLYLLPMFLLALPLLGMSQVQGNAQASSQGPLRATVGTFLFAPGEKIALELYREEPCPCLCGPWEVLSFHVEDAAGKVVYRDRGSYPVPADRWLGIWDFRDDAGAPVAPGDYTLVVETGGGRFQVRVRLLESPLPQGYSLAKASVCGAGISVYRLFTREDSGTAVSLWQGEEIMVLLTGNPTTGYSWEIREEPGVLERLREPEFRPGGELPGAGGHFIFRYRAAKPGEGTLVLVYRRPWEEGPPQGTFSLEIRVKGLSWEF